MSHIHELIDFTASAYIVHNDRVLLNHHKKLNTWLQIGGHIELDETPDQALLREIQEECGLEVEVLAKTSPSTPTKHSTPLWIPHFVNIHDFNETHQHIDMAYVCRAVSDKVTLEEGKAHELRWFTRAELEEADLLPDVRELALNALEIAAASR